MSHTEKIIYFWTVLKSEASPQKKKKYCVQKIPVKINGMIM